jgi:hypothetical protein
MINDLINILKESLFFSRYLHPNTLEYLANCAEIVNSQKYELNILNASGKIPKVSEADFINLDIYEKIIRTDEKKLSPMILNEIKEKRLLYMSERLQPQDLKKMINFLGDFIYVISGKVKVYLMDSQNIDEDANLLFVELKEGDYLDPYCKLESFATKRL